MRNGIPFDVAFEMAPAMRVGLAIIFSEIESGRRFNFRTWDFEDTPP